MIQFELGRIKKVLCLGAHSDDIEIGCGGAILKIIKECPEVEIYWMVFGATGEQRIKEARASAESFLKGVKRKTIVIKSFRDGFFPYVGDQIKDVFEQIKKEFVPDLVFTHFGNDGHQDHRTLSQLAWNTWRNHFILEYEIPKYDGDLGRANAFIPVSRAIADRKVKCLMKYFATQRNKHWFTPDLFYSLMRLRGMESNASSTYAEGFYCRKVVLGAA
jgi:LmbE family N-acetylglucosaminyl deacetylase